MGLADLKLHSGLVGVGRGAGVGEVLLRGSEGGTVVAGRLLSGAVLLPVELQGHIESVSVGEVLEAVPRLLVERDVTREVLLLFFGSSLYRDWPEV